MADPYRQGQNDAASGKGPRDHNSFGSAAEREKYNAGYKNK